jgi:phage terminase large subunit
MRAAGISKSTEIVADSAEPKSIEELRRLGWNMAGAQKGGDSILNSIDILRRYRINITRQSTNLRKELSRYQWKTDGLGRPLNAPTDTWNHLIDPLRYVALNKLKISSTGKTRSRMPWKPEILPVDDMQGLV